ncbi:hypothetical protein GCM10010112_15620 [Actinoplanes lobatus]|nr:hypothetical protein GCM10010112_15620 [Actinoplanes lobatus]
MNGVTRLLGVSAGRVCGVSSHEAVGGAAVTAMGGVGAHAGDVMVAYLSARGDVRVRPPRLRPDVYTHPR